MKKIIANIIKFKKTYLITFFVSLVIGIGIFLIYYFVHSHKFIGSLDGTGVASLALGGVSLLLWFGRLGAYDSMSYGFKQMFSSMFGKNPNKFNNFASYKEDKNTKRTSSPKYYFVSFFVAVLFALVYLILYIIYIKVIKP